MFALLAAAGVLIAQAGSAASLDNSAQDSDVAYAQLVAGETQAAITRLEAVLAENPGDPAILINLGSAYVELGDLDRAAAAYQAAASSEDRYLLELADGQWVDSRTAARRALQTLETRGFALNQHR